MTPISNTPDHPVGKGRTPGTDLAARLKVRARQLRAQLERRDVMLDAVRGSNASADPKAVASWLVHHAMSWIPASCWVVIAPDMDGEPAVLAEDGLTATLEPAAWAAARWVLHHGVEFLTGDLASDPRTSHEAGGSVIAFPLACRHRTVGALVGVDQQPSRSAPALGAALATALAAVLDPPSIALDNALALQKAEALSVTDDLTRLYNSRYLNLVLRREAKRSMRSGRALSLLFIDLDGFKAVNDNHGHLSGGKALVEAGTIIRASARETDVAVRFGGDEFAVVLPDTAHEGALSVAERIRDRIRVHRFLGS